MSNDIILDFIVNTPGPFGEFKTETTSSNKYLSNGYRRNTGIKCIDS